MDDAAPVAVVLCSGYAGHAERVPWVTHPTWTAPTDGQCTVRPETSVTVNGMTWSAGWHSCDNCGHEGHFWSNRWSYGGGKVTEEQCPVCRQAYVPDNPDEAVVDAVQGHEIGEKDVDDMVDQGHEVVGNPPGTSERPPEPPPTGQVDTVGGERMAAEAERVTVREMVGLPAHAPSEQLLDRIQDLKIGLPEAERASLRVRLGLPDTAGWADILTAVEGSTAPGTQQMDALRRRMGLSTDTNWLGILLKLGAVVEVANRWGPVCDALGLDHTTSVGELLEEIGRLQRADESMNPDDRRVMSGRDMVRMAKALGIPETGVPFKQMLEVARLQQKAAQEHAGDRHAPSVTEMTMEEAERQRQQRQEALHTVMDLWAQHRLGEDMPDAEDLVSLTHYLATGDTSLVQEVQRQRLQFAQEERRRYELAPDAARWSGGGESE